MAIWRDRAQAKVGLNYELLTYEAIKRAKKLLGENFSIEFQKEYDLPTRPDIIIPSKKVIFLVQNQEGTAIRYPFYNKLSQLFSFKSLETSEELECKGVELAIVGVFFQNWTNNLIKIGNTLYDYAQFKPENDFLNDPSEFYRVVKKVAEEEITEGTVNIDPDRVAKKIITKINDRLQEDINILLDGMANRFADYLKSDKLVRARTSSFWAYEKHFAKSEKFCRALQNPEEVSDYEIESIFDNIVKLGRNLPHFKAVIRELLEGGGSCNKEELIRKIKNTSVEFTEQSLRTLEELGFLKEKKTKVLLMRETIELFDFLREFEDSETLRILLFGKNQILGDKLTQSWLQEIRNRFLIREKIKKLIHPLRSLENPTAEEIRAALLQSIENHGYWPAIEIYCKIVDVKKQNIPSRFHNLPKKTKLLKGYPESLWPNRLVGGLRTNPDILTAKEGRVESIIDIFAYEVGGIKSLYRKIVNLNIDEVVKDVKRMRIKQLVGKKQYHLTALEYLTSYVMNKSNIGYLPVKSIDQVEDTSLVEFFRENCPKSVTIVRKSVIPGFQFKLPLRDGTNLYVYSKSDLSGSNPGFVRGKMILARYGWDGNQIIELPRDAVFVTDHCRERPVLEAFWKQGLKILQLNTIEGAAKNLKRFLQLFPTYSQEEMIFNFDYEEMNGNTLQDILSLQTDKGLWDRFYRLHPRKSTLKLTPLALLILADKYEEIPSRNHKMKEEVKISIESTIYALDEEQQVNGSWNDNERTTGSIVFVLSLIRTRKIVNKSLKEIVDRMLKNALKYLNGKEYGEISSFSQLALALNVPEKIREGVDLKSLKAYLLNEETSITEKLLEISAVLIVTPTNQIRDIVMDFLKSTLNKSQVHEEWKLEIPERFRSIVQGIEVNGQKQQGPSFVLTKKRNEIKIHLEKNLPLDFEAKIINPDGDPVSIYETSSFKHNVNNQTLSVYINLDGSVPISVRGSFRSPMNEYLCKKLIYPNLERLQAT